MSKVIGSMLSMVYYTKGLVYGLGYHLSLILFCIYMFPQNGSLDMCVLYVFICMCVYVMYQHDVNPAIMNL